MRLGLLTLTDRRLIGNAIMINIRTSVWRSCTNRGGATQVTERILIEGVAWQLL